MPSLGDAFRSLGRTSKHVLHLGREQRVKYIFDVSNMSIASGLNAHDPQSYVVQIRRGSKNVSSGPSARKDGCLSFGHERLELVATIYSNAQSKAEEKNYHVSVHDKNGMREIASCDDFNVADYINAKSRERRLRLKRLHGGGQALILDLCVSARRVKSANQDNDDADSTVSLSTLGSSTCSRAESNEQDLDGFTAETVLERRRDRSTTNAPSNTMAISLPVATAVPPAVPPEPSEVIVEVATAPPPEPPPPELDCDPTPASEVLKLSALNQLASQLSSESDHGDPEGPKLLMASPAPAIIATAGTATSMQTSSRSNAPPAELLTRPSESGAAVGSKTQKNLELGWGLARVGAKGRAKEEPSSAPVRVAQGCVQGFGEEELISFRSFSTRGQKKVSLEAQNAASLAASAVGFAGDFDDLGAMRAEMSNLRRGLMGMEPRGLRSCRIEAAVSEEESRALCCDNAADGEDSVLARACAMLAEPLAVAEPPATPMGAGPVAVAMAAANVAADEVSTARAPIVSHATIKEGATIADASKEGGVAMSMAEELRELKAEREHLRHQLELAESALQATNDSDALRQLISWKLTAAQYAFERDEAFAKLRKLQS